MKVKTLREYLIGLPEEFDDFYVKMTKHEFSVDGSLKRFVENIHGTIARLETKEVFLLDEVGSDYFDHLGNRSEDELDLQITPRVEDATYKDSAFNMQVPGWLEDYKIKQKKDI